MTITAVLKHLQSTEDDFICVDTIPELVTIEYNPSIVPIDFKRDYSDLIMIEIDRFDQPMTKTLLSFLKKRYGDRFWYCIDIAGDDRLDAYLIAGTETRGDEEVVHIYSIAVRIDFEGEGWAKKLMHQLIHDARAEGLDAIILEVRDNNTRAKAFYLNLEFEITGRVRDYYKPGLDAITMTYELS